MPFAATMLSILFSGWLYAYEWTGRSPDLDGIVITSSVEGGAVVLFGANGKIYSNILAREGCDWGRLQATAGGSGDADQHLISTGISAVDGKGDEVLFDLVLTYHEKTCSYEVITLRKHVN